ncbi:unnamed protein product [Acanthosepion pharaonis]|uniref:Uncharacterized protein n=1 Tax=Acanthosepion pharaonis TaxID=158019 RepID=A0A812BDV1_ACAPH|nr:unnamed protein product [Sepia pharaonis]
MCLQTFLVSSDSEFRRLLEGVFLQHRLRKEMRLLNSRQQHLRTLCTDVHFRVYNKTNANVPYPTGIVTHSPILSPSRPSPTTHSNSLSEPTPTVSDYTINSLFTANSLSEPTVSDYTSILFPSRPSRTTHSNSLSEPTVSDYTLQFSFRADRLGLHTPILFLSRPSLTTHSNSLSEPTVSDYTLQFSFRADRLALYTRPSGTTHYNSLSEPTVLIFLIINYYP